MAISCFIEFLSGIFFIRGLAPSFPQQKTPSGAVGFGVDRSIGHFCFAQIYTDLKAQIFEIRRIRIPFNEGDELEKVRAALGVASAQIRQDRSFAALQKGHGDLLAALGIDQIPEGFKPDSPTAADDSAAGRIRGSRRHW